MTENWNGLPREVAESLFLEISDIHLSNPQMTLPASAVHQLSLAILNYLLEHHLSPHRKTKQTSTQITVFDERHLSHSEINYLQRSTKN